MSVFARCCCVSGDDGKGRFFRVVVRGNDRNESFGWEAAIRLAENFSGKKQKLSKNEGSWTSKIAFYWTCFCYVFVQSADI